MSGPTLGYVIERKVYGSSEEFVPIARVGKISGYRDKNCNVNTIYLYRIKAYNAQAESGYSNILGIKTTTGIPIAPISLSVLAVNSSSASLSWTDNSTDATGYKIERKIQTDPVSSFVQIGTALRIPAMSTVGTYLDTSVPTTNDYTYRVRSYSVYGNSPYSNSVNVHIMSVIEHIADIAKGILGYLPIVIYPDPFILSSIDDTSRLTNPSPPPGTLSTRQLVALTHLSPPAIWIELRSPPLVVPPGGYNVTPIIDAVQLVYPAYTSMGFWLNTTGTLDYNKFPPFPGGGDANIIT